MGTGHIDVLGARVGHGGGALAVMVAAASLGYVGGALAGWVVEVRGGRELLERHGRLVQLGPERLAQAEAWFQRRDWATVIGSTAWALVLGSVGYGVGASWDTAHRHFRYLDYLAVALVAAAALWLVARRRRPSQRPG